MPPPGGTNNQVSSVSLTPTKPPSPTPPPGARAEAGGRVARRGAAARPRQDAPAPQHGVHDEEGVRVSDVPTPRARSGAEDAPAPRPDVHDEEGARGPDVPAPQAQSEAGDAPAPRPGVHDEGGAGWSERDAECEREVHELLREAQAAPCPSAAPAGNRGARHQGGEQAPAPTGEASRFHLPSGLLEGEDDAAAGEAGSAGR